MNKPKYFTRSEFKCKCGCGFNVVDFELMIVLEDIRERFAAPVIIHSGCRCEKYNQSVGGSPQSQHLLGKAADIHISSISLKRIHEYLNAKYPSTYGIGLYDSFIHIDVRQNKTRW